MNFRQVLSQMTVDRMYDSGYLASLIKCSKKDASKYLHRLYRMGFLKRIRYKRLCISKNDKVCYKGYFYMYTFSNQGKQYVRWISQNEPIDAMASFDIISEVTPFLDEEEKRNIMTLIQSRESLRYKGPNKSLETLGTVFPVLPILTRHLKETIKQKKELEEKYVHLKEDLKKRDKKIKDLENENREIKQEGEIVRKEINDLIHTLIQRCINAKKREFFDFECKAALLLINLFYERVIIDLSKVLYIAKPSVTDKIIEMIIRYHKNILERAEDHLRRAEDFG